jgi:DNA-binding NarL/FixJ family response regulator
MILQSSWWKIMTMHEGILDLFLGQLGAKVVVASNAFEGLEAIKNTLPDLVLSDIQMPGMDGFDLLEEVRALGPDAGGNVPGYSNERVFSRWQTAREYIMPTFGHACRSHSHQTS